MNISLVLSGGGARSFAQIGVLKALEEANIRPSAISGTSTGAILGALYAAGHRADKLFDIASGVDYSTFLKRGGKGGLIGHAGIEAVLRPHLPERFEALEIPLAVTSVDIQSAELLIFRQGPLLSAICASNAFPGLFEPVRFEGRYLMDGGILDNVPVDVGQMMNNDPLLVIDTVPSPRRKLDFGDGDDGGENPGLVKRLLAPLQGDGPSLPLLIEVLEKAYTITQSRLIELRSAMFPPDAVLRPDLPEDFGVQDFGRLEEAHGLGYRAARQLLANGAFGP